MNDVEQLSAVEQDAIAQRILSELADEQQWEKAFADSQDALTRLAVKVRADIQASNT